MTRPGWKGTPRTNALAYLTSSSVVKERRLVRLTLIANALKLSSSSPTARQNELKLFSLVNHPGLIFVIRTLPYPTGAPVVYHLG